MGKAFLEISDVGFKRDIIALGFGHGSFLFCSFMLFDMAGQINAHQGDDWENAQGKKNNKNNAFQLHEVPIWLSVVHI